jgi:hypothetical protein
MQELEIKDVQSGAVYRIAPQGSVIGREGAKADIIIKNPSVSKRHARIFATDGQWFLEDLGSSNGTFFANQRISEPVPLGGGTLFALAEIQFEVVKKGGDERGGGGGGRDRAERDRLRAATAARPDEGELLGANGNGGGSTARPSNNRNAPPAAAAFASNDAGEKFVKDDVKGQYIIIVLTDGRIAEEGDFASLTARSGAFARLVVPRLPGASGTGCPGAGAQPARWMISTVTLVLPSGPARLAKRAAASASATRPSGDRDFSGDRAPIAVRSSNSANSEP